jgi:hypothetical protein
LICRCRVDKACLPAGRLIKLIRKRAVKKIRVET